ncbi:choice-of-anchor K domain-containing protein [Fortiea contorta]|uniref:choice-of-anchor K domain-containing protein n=1 Tax=Fortiea contorta TaxID=1892405 RepID=UPI000347A264|nr:choice-of-anchor K domain-containing protein [Fortiea contorta]
MKLSLVFATTLSSCSILAMTTFGFLGQALAGTISGKSSGTWVNPTVVDSNVQLVHTGVNTNSFTWGEPVPGTPANQLVYTGSSFLADVGSWFQIGSFTYQNGTVYADTGVDAVTFNLAMSFGDQAQSSQVLPISFSFKNTLNDLSVGLRDPKNADSVQFFKSANPSFSLGGNNYTLEIGGFSPNNQNTEITALEGDQITAGFYARINPSDTQSSPPKDVPEAPSILGSLLVGTYLIYRKKFSQVKAK